MNALLSQERNGEVLDYLRNAHIVNLSKAKQTLILTTTLTTLNLTITDPHDAYETVFSAVGIGTWKTLTTANTLTTCAIDVCTMSMLYDAY